LLPVRHLLAIEGGRAPATINGKDGFAKPLKHQGTGNAVIMPARPHGMAILRLPPMTGIDPPMTSLPAAVVAAAPVDRKNRSDRLGVAIHNGPGQHIFWPSAG
jgi:hypothetical protein